MNDLMLTTPGVALQEIPFNPPTIAGVATAIPAFIGPVTASAAPDGGDLIGRTWRISSITEFELLFGVPVPSTTRIEVTKRVGPGGVVEGNDISFSTPPERVPSGALLLYHAVDLYLANGGGPCHIRPIDISANAVSNYADALVALESTDEITLNVILNTIGTTSDVDYGGLVTASLASCRKMKDRFTICDVLDAFPGGLVDNTVPGVDISTQATNICRNNITAVAEDVLKYGAAYIPALHTSVPILFNTDSIEIVGAASQLETYDAEGALINSVDLTPGGADLPLSDAFFQGDVGPPITPGEKGIEEDVLALMGRTTLIMPPSPAMAGIYARVDRNNGVHVAPANVGMVNITAPALIITDADHGLLNVDQPSGKSINAIRFFTGRGTLPRGARTLSGNSGDWKFINRRRAAIYLEESITDALDQFVFQPNVTKTHLRVKRMVTGFLQNEWRAGTLTGPTPADAFDVTIGLGTTMTQQDIVDGIMRLLVRVALPGPAEKIILQFTQKAQTA